jgi:hypothetical protein
MNNNFNNSELLKAVKIPNNQRKIADLIKDGADPDYQDENGATPLNQSVTIQNNLENIGALMNVGVDVNLKNKNGDTALHKAVEIHNNRENIMELGVRGADTDITNSRGYTPLEKVVTMPNNVENIKSYQVETWDLKRSRKYGSDHHNTKTLNVKNAILSKDKKEVFLSIIDLKTTNVMEITFQFLDDNGKIVKGLIQNTINQIGK